MTRRAWHQCLMLWVVPAALCGCGPPDDDELDGGLWSTEIAAVPASSWLLEPARGDTSPPEPASSRLLEPTRGDTSPASRRLLEPSRRDTSLSEPASSRLLEPARRDTSPSEPTSSWLLEPGREDTSPPESAVPDAPGGPVASQAPPGDEDGGADLWRPEEGALLSSAEVPTLDLPLDDVVEEEGEDFGVESEPAPELAPEHGAGRALEEAGLHAGVMIVERLPEFGEWETPEDEVDVTPRVATLVAGTAEGVEFVEVVEVL